MSSSNIQVDTLYDMEAIKDVLDEDGITANESKIGDYGKESENEVNNAMRYFGFVFPLNSTDMGQTDYDIARGICNKLVRGLFWKEGSGADDILLDARAELEKFRIRLASQPPSLTL